MVRIDYYCHLLNTFRNMSLALVINFSCSIFNSILSFEYHLSKKMIFYSRNGEDLFKDGKELIIILSLFLIIFYPCLPIVWGNLDGTDF